MIKKFPSFRVVELPVECLLLYPFSAWYSPGESVFSSQLLHGLPAHLVFSTQPFTRVGQGLTACVWRLAGLAWEGSTGVSSLG